MRRFLAFVMCVSGFTLAVSWARADEPTAAPSDGGPTSTEVAVPPPRGAVAAPVRPPIVRTEPGEYRRQTVEQPADSESRNKESTADQLQQQIDQLHELASQLNEQFVGPALEHAQSVIEAQIAQIEAMQRQAAIIQQETTAQEIGVLEQHLTDLLAHAERLESSAGEQVDAMRQVMEQRLDTVERALAERRERRDAASDRPQRDATSNRPQPALPEGDPAMRELHEKIRHLSAALEHLRTGGFEDLARETERRTQELTAAHQQMRRRAAEAREQRDDDEELEPIRGAVRDLTNEVGELRREVRRLHREVDQLRRPHHEPDEEPSHREPEEPDGDRSDV